IDYFRRYVFRNITLNYSIGNSFGSSLLARTEAEFNNPFALFVYFSKSIISGFSNSGLKI
ncbi:hypothetical protein N8328_06425, partial [Crocinitomicaceae bacterium]|nr:hypothetical protein [Crocinitomicaceae bacterium]